MTFVYQAYGAVEILEQTLFSIISLLKKLPASSHAKAMVYTDQPIYFEKFLQAHPQVEIVSIPYNQFVKWRGAIDFVHRVKLEVLRNAGQRFDGNLIYLDGDTYFTADPSSLGTQIDDNNSLMHIAESRLGDGRDPLTKKICKFAKKNQFEVGGTRVPLSESTVMWNAGVIGVSQKNKSLFNEMIELTDKMFVVYPKHVIEQLAVSIMLCWKTKVHACDNVIYHYWNQKPEYQLEIQKFLTANPNLQTALECYENFTFPEPPRAANKSWLSRLFFNS